jgi:hypothetical protein
MVIHMERILGKLCEFLPQIERSDLGLYDLMVERQVQLLEYLKRFKDIERGKCRGKGFRNCWKSNSKRNPHVFTNLEAQFHRLAQGFALELNHEVHVKVKDRLNRWHTFKLDFYEPKKAINVEINPNWHRDYTIIARRDVLRKMLLKRLGIRSLTVPVVPKGRRGQLNLSLAKRVIKVVRNARISPNCLDYYIGHIGGET